MPSGMSGNNDAQTRKVIYVTKLPKRPVFKTLVKYFMECGIVESCDIGGCTAYIRFISQEDAEKAVALKHNSLFQGQVINVKLL